MKTYVQLLDLRDDPSLIEEYKRLHQSVWPEVIRSLRETGVIDMTIYCYGNRLVMVLKTEDHYQIDEAFQQYLNYDPACAAWEEKMDLYQMGLPGTPAGQKWVPMESCFDLSDYA